MSSSGALDVGAYTCIMLMLTGWHLSFIIITLSDTVQQPNTDTQTSLVMMSVTPFAFCSPSEYSIVWLSSSKRLFPGH